MTLKAQFNQIAGQLTANELICDYIKKYRFIKTNDNTIPLETTIKLVYLDLFYDISNDFGTTSGNYDKYINDDKFKAKFKYKTATWFGDNIGWKGTLTNQVIQDMLKNPSILENSKFCIIVPYQELEKDPSNNILKSNILKII